MSCREVFLLEYNNPGGVGTPVVGRADGVITGGESGGYAQKMINKAVIMSGVKNFRLLLHHQKSGSRGWLAMLLVQ